MIRERLGKELLYFDGGMGTLLQAKGLQPGELPETWNVTHADEIKNIHKQYISAGSDIVLANTFGANALKFHCKWWKKNLHSTGCRTDRKAFKTDG